ncbi:MAG: hypothetical protein M1838_001022 [Thelocarpon superellum]|nr:MAG: hypothetical protein M1838_001022 [Thelocarpon superellum]
MNIVPAVHGQKYCPRSNSMRQLRSSVSVRARCKNAPNGSGGTGRVRSYATTGASAEAPRGPRPPTSIKRAEAEVARLAATPLYPLALADLVRYGRPPLDASALLSSANFTLSLLPHRLAHRIQSLRNLPFIVVSNPHISKIYHNYLHSLSTLLPYTERPVSSMAEESTFTEVMADLVQTHANTIPTLARGFLECRKYIDPAEVTRFLDEHLRARIGTRLIAEQHIALHVSSQPQASGDGAPSASSSSYIGVIDTSLRPATVIHNCGSFVSEICELKYGVRPSLVIDGQPDTTFAYVPVHLEYIITELLKNAFRASVETGMEREPVAITIAAAPEEGPPATGEEASSIPGVTVRIRDRGGGISPEHLPNIWSYSFTTFSDEDLPAGVVDGSVDALNAISASGGGSSSIAGLGYGLPLSRAYAEYFNGGIAVQSMWGWGTDVYLSLRGVGKLE